MHVLVVDDSKVIQDSLCKLLVSLGYSVETACNGLDALEKAQSNSHDLYIIDHLMPLMNGVQLSKNLSNNTHCQNTPILFISTQDLKHVKQLAEYPLFSGVLSKPIQENDFLMALDLIEENRVVENSLSVVL
jgi:two-component system chemotaxis response regulator CheY